jgi:ketosteroid isomerase-like protein
MASILRTATWSLALAVAMVSGSCGWKPATAVTTADSAAVHRAIETTWREMMAGARSLDPDRVRAGYIEHPVAAINGRIVEDFDRDQFDETRRWLRSLRQFDATYDQVHVQVMSTSAAVATMRHHLRWIDSAGAPGEWNSAWTAVFQQVDGRWKIAYSHESTAEPAR